MTYVNSRFSLFVVMTLIIVTGLITGGPAAAQMLQVRGDLSPGFNVLSGGVYERTLTVTNVAGAAQNVRMYLLDEEYTEAGDASYQQPGSLIRSLAPWIVIDGPEFTLQPGEAREVRYHLNVPSETDLSGTYWTTMLIEGQPVDSPSRRDESGESVQEDVFSFGFRLRVRHALPMRATFPDKGERELGFGNPALNVSTSDDESQVHLSFMLINRGESEANDVALSVNLYDSSGHSVSNVSGRVGHLLPGQAKRASLELGSLAPGNYQAIVFADVGDGDIFGARYALNVNP